MIQSIKIVLPGNQRSSLYVVDSATRYTDEKGLQTPARVKSITVEGPEVIILFGDDLGEWVERFYGCPYRTEEIKILYEPGT